MSDCQGEGGGRKQENGPAAYDLALFPGSGGTSCAVPQTQRGAAHLPASLASQCSSPPRLRLWAVLGAFTLAFQLFPLPLAPQIVASRPERSPILKFLPTGEEVPPETLPVHQSASPDARQN